MGDWIPILLSMVVAFGVLGVGIADRLNQRRRKRRLLSRTQRNDEEFARTFYPEPTLGDLAIRVRHILAAHLKLDIGGLEPADRLDEDLRAKFPSDLSLVFALDNEFGSRMGGEDFTEIESIGKDVITFQNLVEHVAKRIADPAFKIIPEEEIKNPRAYDWAVRSILPLCGCGFVVVIAGICAQKPLLMNSGGAIFLSGIVVWGIANGSGMLWMIIQQLRKGSVKEALAHPVPLLIVSGLALFFLWVGGFLLWAMVRNLLAGR